MTLSSDAITFVGFSEMSKYRLASRCGRVDGLAWYSKVPDGGTVIEVSSLSGNWMAGPVCGSSAVVSLITGEVEVMNSLRSRIVLPAGALPPVVEGSGEVEVRFVASEKAPGLPF